MRRIILVAALIFSPAGQAAEVLPSAGKAVGLVRDDTPGSWAVVAQDFSSIEVKEFEGSADAGYLGCYFEGVAGQRYLAIKSGGGKLKTFAVTLGGVSPDIPPAPVVVIPPGPVVPVVPPQPAGPRTVLIVRESAKDSPSDGRMFTSLQAGLAHQYLKSKGHGCFILDADPDKEPNAKAEAWKAALGISLPALAILDDKGAVLFKVSLAEGATADEVVSILKSKGG